MGSLGSCVFMLVMFVQLQLILGKPFFMDLICDYICDDDDDATTTTTASNDDDYSDYFDICSCGTRRPPGTRRGQNLPSNINMRLPPSPNGMNFSMNNTNGVWSFSLDAGPNGPPGGPPGSPPGGPPGPPPGVIPLAGLPPAPPPVPGAATAAAGATTVAPTTAKK